jgi:thiamine-monophosphate kinase
VGGDLAALNADTEVATLTIMGEVPTGRAILRSGARPGDALYVTGEIGNSFDSRHHLNFSPRLAEGVFLRGKATAMLDVSDGLLLDALRMARASQVDIRICAEAVPLRAGAVLPDALGDGEDYELLFSAPPELGSAWGSGFAALTRIGEVLPGSGRVLDENGNEYNFTRSGYEH